jgi:hypothetical protein
MLKSEELGSSTKTMLILNFQMVELLLMLKICYSTITVMAYVWIYTIPVLPVDSKYSVEMSANQFDIKIAFWKPCWCLWSIYSVFC